MNDDATLLRDYADHGLEAAFAEVVRRRIDLVYAAALRRTGGDAHRARDAAQHVFTQLARNARKLSRHPSLSAWLHTATRNAALNLMLSDRRRQIREAEALAESAVHAAGAPNPEWERLRPLLDAAIDELPEPDRAAVVLRFLERRGFAEIGATLRVSTDAARMRTERAVEKLRVALARRGITSTAAALSALVASQPLISAPAGLAASLAAQSLAAAGSASFATSLFALMNTKLIVTAALVGVAAFFAGSRLAGSRAADIAPTAIVAADASRQSQVIASLRSENQRLSADLSALMGEVTRLKEANVALASAQKTTPAATSERRSTTMGLARWELQEAMYNNLRQIAAAREQFVLENSRSPSALREIVGRTAYIRTIRPIDGEDYSQLSMNTGDPLTVTLPDGTPVTFDPNNPANSTPPEIPAEVKRVRELGPKMQPLINHALQAYRAANGGNAPKNQQALIPYFATPKDGADFVEFLEAQKAANSR
jgi:RNA polymerase sigma factor (sigma-70 family)